MSKSLSRQEKLDNIPGEKYPRDFPGRIPVQTVLDWYITNRYDKYPDPKAIFKIAGRVLSRRDHGNNVFFDLIDQSGAIQLHAKNDNSEQPNAQQEAFSDALECDLGDVVGVTGTLGANPRGEVLFQIDRKSVV